MYKTDLRKEYDKMRFSGELARKCGTECVSCGAKENIEYHHIIPLALGGSNRIRNIVPLCHQCHKAAHGAHHRSYYSDSNNGGRKPKVADEEAFKTYDLWLDGQIGTRKCKELLNLEQATHVKSTVQYERWCDSRGIKTSRHNLDASIVNSPHKVVEGYVIGYVIYADGRRVDIKYHDTGLNDDTVYEVRSTTPIGCRDENGKKHPMTWKEIKEICRADNAKRKKRRRVSREEVSPVIDGFEEWKAARRSAQYDEEAYFRGERIPV